MAKRKSSIEKRKNIRYAAYLCFRDNGYYQTSIDDICAAANISKGSFYWHYGAKLDVFIDILETWAREVVDELLEQFEEASQSPDRLQLLSKAFEREFHRARAIVPVWIECSMLGRHDRELQISLGKFFRRARAAIAEILRHTVQDQLSEQEIRASASVIFGTYMGLTIQEFADPNLNAADWSKNFMGVLKLLFNNSTQRASVEGERATTKNIQKMLKGSSAVQKKVFHRLRKEIVNAHPESDEKWIQGWRAMGYRTQGLICHLKIRPTGVELNFYKGANISDPNGLLSGSGKYRRSVVITQLEPPDGIPDLIRQAFSEKG